MSEGAFTQEPFRFDIPDDRRDRRSFTDGIALCRRVIETGLSGLPPTLVLNGKVVSDYNLGSSVYRDMVENLSKIEEADLTVNQPPGPEGKQ
jgi:hypothetical protein